MLLYKEFKEQYPDDDAQGLVYLEIVNHSSNQILQNINHDIPPFTFITHQLCYLINSLHSQWIYKLSNWMHLMSTNLIYCTITKDIWTRMFLCCFNEHFPRRLRFVFLQSNKMNWWPWTLHPNHSEIIISAVDFL